MLSLQRAGILGAGALAKLYQEQKAKSAGTNDHVNESV